MKAGIDYTFKIIEEILTLKTYNSKEEMMQVAQIMCEKANAKDCPQEYKDFYQEAYNRLSTLTFDEVKEIVDILSSNSN